MEILEFRSKLFYERLLIGWAYIRDNEKDFTEEKKELVDLLAEMGMKESDSQGWLCKKYGWSDKAVSFKKGWKMEQMTKVMEAIIYEK